MRGAGELCHIPPWSLQARLDPPVTVSYCRHGIRCRFDVDSVEDLPEVVGRGASGVGAGMARAVSRDVSCAPKASDNRSNGHAGLSHDL
jgi:hypothetical protein